MDILESMDLSVSSLLLIVVVFIFIILGLLSLVLRQKQEIVKLEDKLEPKYGFLGKPMVSIVAVFIMIGGFGLTYYASQNVQNVQVSASKDLQLQITTMVGNATNGQYPLSINLIPTVEGYQWGNAATDEFDVFWYIKGQDKEYTKVELALSRDNSGGTTLLLPRGSYEVSVEVIYAKKVWTERVQVNIGLN